MQLKSQIVFDYQTYLAYFAFLFTSDVNAFIYLFSFEEQSAII